MFTPYLNLAEFTSLLEDLELCDYYLTWMSVFADLCFVSTADYRALNWQRKDCEKLLNLQADAQPQITFSQMMINAWTT